MTKPRRIDKIRILQKPKGFIGRASLDKRLNFLSIFRATPILGAVFFRLKINKFL
nr:MAG TPA: hypothetical protein [Caudoviricetes sp.]